VSHLFRVRVYYEDVDLAGIVYYANHLRFIERARSEMIRGLGIDQSRLRAEGTVFAVTRVEADYLAPARYDDMLEVATSVERATPARLVLRQQIARDGAVLFRARVTVAAMGTGGRPRRLPEALRRLAP
jgi:acyl-CoA thioester hydrolase